MLGLQCSGFRLDRTLVARLPRRKQGRQRIHAHIWDAELVGTAVFAVDCIISHTAATRAAAGEDSAPAPLLPAVSYALPVASFVSHLTRSAGSWRTV